MNKGSFDKLAFRLLPVTLPFLGFLILLVGYQQAGNFFSELGADTAFGKIKPPAIADLRQGKEIKALVGNLEKGDFERLAKVAEIGARNISLSKEQAIAESLGFTGGSKEVKDPGGSKKRVWQVSGKILEVVSEQGRVTYADFEAVVERKAENQTVANKIAQEFLQANELLADLKISATNPVSIEKGRVVKTKTDFNGFEVLFSNRLDQYKIITPNLEGSAAIVVGVDGKIKRLTYLLPAEVLKTALYPIIGRGQAIKSLNSGKAVISELVFGGSRYLTGEQYNIKMIKVSEMDLVYVDDGETTYLQPHYQFKGEAVLTDGRSGIITFLVNAIKDKYLK